MHHDGSSPGRSAREDERARLAAARSSLRASARWQSLIAFGIPSVLAVGVLSSTLVNYPGSWLEVLLLSLLQVVVVFAVFAGPTLLLGGYNVVAMNGRLAQDAAQAGR